MQMMMLLLMVTCGAGTRAATRRGPKKDFSDRNVPSTAANSPPEESRVVPCAGNTARIKGRENGPKGHSFLTAWNSHHGPGCPCPGCSPENKNEEKAPSAPWTSRPLLAILVTKALKPTRYRPSFLGTHGIGKQKKWTRKCGVPDSHFDAQKETEKWFGELIGAAGCGAKLVTQKARKRFMQAVKFILPGVGGLLDKVVKIGARFIERQAKAEMEEHVTQVLLHKQDCPEFQLNVHERLCEMIETSRAKGNIFLLAVGTTKAKALARLETTSMLEEEGTCGRTITAVPLPEKEGCGLEVTEPQLKVCKEVLKEEVQKEVKEAERISKEVQKEVQNEVKEAAEDLHLEECAELLRDVHEGIASVCPDFLMEAQRDFFQKKLISAISSIMENDSAEVKGKLERRQNKYARFALDLVSHLKGNTDLKITNLIHFCESLVQAYKTLLAAADGPGGRIRCPKLAIVVEVLEMCTKAIIGAAVAEKLPRAETSSDQDSVVPSSRANPWEVHCLYLEFTRNLEGSKVDAVFEGACTVDAVFEEACTTGVSDLESISADYVMPMEDKWRSFTNTRLLPAFRIMNATGAAKSTRST